MEDDSVAEAGERPASEDGPYTEKSAGLKPGLYNGLVGTRSFRARGTILNWTGRRARGSPSTWA